MDKAADAVRQEQAGPYRVLARKYRPQDFSGLIGQEPMVRTLTNAFRTGRIAQAWMLTGVRGVGKTTTARILARALNYQSDTVNEPSVDLSVPGLHCQAIMEGRHVDVIEMDAASHTGIDAVRDIIDRVRYAPVSARYKVYIIDEVHMLTTQAFNGLLKTLEEPPPHVKFIFATTEIRKVPVTVLSRCQRFDLRRVGADELTRHLRMICDKEGVEAEEEALAMVARAAEGSVRDALSILDQAIAHSASVLRAQSVREMLGLADRARVIDLFELLMAGDVAGALREFREQYDRGADPAVVLGDLAGFTHLVTRLRYVPEAARDASLTEEERGRGADFAGRLPVRVLSRAWQMLLTGIEEVQRASQPLAAAEMVLIRIAHAASLPTLDEALAKLEGAAEPGAHAAPAGNAAPRPLSPQGGGGAAMRAMQPEPAAPEPGRREPKPEVTLRSLEDLVALAEARRDLALKILVKKHIRLVHMEPGRMEISLAGDAPRDLPGQLSRKLGDWTGINWFVTLSQKEGGPTLAEREARNRAAAVESAETDPTVAAVLAAFPGSRILDVRLAPELVADDAFDNDPDAEPGETDAEE